MVYKCHLYSIYPVDIVHSDRDITAELQVILGRMTYKKLIHCLFSVLLIKRLVFVWVCAGVYVFTSNKKKEQKKLCV